MQRAEGCQPRCRVRVVGCLWRDNVGADAITGYCVGYRPDRQAGQLVLTVALQLHVQSGEHLAGGRTVPRLCR